MSGIKAKSIEPILLTKTQVCQLCGGVSADRLEKMRRDPDIEFPPPVAIPGHPMWRRKDIERFVERIPVRVD